MENWSNLTVILEKLKQEQNKKDFLSNLLIEECGKGNKETVKKVLQAGAYPNCFSGKNTPLIATLKGDFNDVTEFLVKIGASPGYKPNDKFLDAVWFALINKKYVALNMFILARCNLNRHPISGMTLLGYATDNSDLTAVEFLLRHKDKKINERDLNGNTALHYNMKKADMNNEDIVIGKLLLAAGASTTLPNKDGKTPAQLAAEAGEALIAEQEMLQDLEEEMIEQNRPAPKKQKVKKW